LNILAPYPQGVVSVVELARGTGFTVGAVTCDDDHTRWSAPESRDGFDVVLVRRGRFRRRSGGVAADVDVTMAYVGAPGAEDQFAHPSGGDRCTWINLTPACWEALAADAVPTRGAAFYVDARVDLAHRRLGRRVTPSRPAGAGAGREEPLLDLVAAVLRQISAGPTPADVPPGRADRTVVAAAREAVLADLPESAALLPLAARLGVSPYRLSRAFTREVGVPLSRYRNRVRLARALDRIEAGDPHLGRLAADLGFADQAHLTRTVRQHLGRTPTALRGLLG
jgi:AraC-like DNA-binding protein